MTRVAVLTGLKREAALVSAAFQQVGRGVTIQVAGIDRARAWRAAERLATEQPELIVSFGIAAGLDPSLAPGQLGMPRTIVAPDGSQYVGETVHFPELTNAIPGAAKVLAGVDEPVVTPLEKRALACRTGARLADMESHLAAVVARRTGCRLLVLRVVTDPVDRHIPPPFTAALTADGGVRWSTVPAMLTRPRTLYILARDSRRAFATLGRVADALARVV